MVMIMIIVSMRRDYVCELPLPVGLLFIPEVIYEHGEPRWNYIDRRNPLIRPPELWQSYQQSRLVAKLEELAKEINFALGSISFIL
jgi:hypothetical protein